MIRLTTAQHKSDTTALPDQDWFVDPTAITQVLPFWGEEAAANYPKGQSIVVVAPDTEGREVQENPEQVLGLCLDWRQRHLTHYNHPCGSTRTGSEVLYLYLNEAGEVGAAFR